MLTSVVSSRFDRADRVSSGLRESSQPIRYDARWSMLGTTVAPYNGPELRQNQCVWVGVREGRAGEE